MHITCESALAFSFLSFIIILFLCLIMAHKLASTFTFSSASIYCWFIKVTTISWLAGWFVSLVNRFWRRKAREATEEDTRATKTGYKLLNPSILQAISYTISILNWLLPPALHLFMYSSVIAAKTLKELSPVICTLILVAID